MTNERIKKAGWYLDATKSDKKIQCVEHLRGMIGCDLLGAKKIADQAFGDHVHLTSTRVLPSIYRNTIGMEPRPMNERDWIAAFASAGAALTWHGSLKKGSPEAIDQAMSLIPQMAQLMAFCPTKALRVLARFYGIKGRSRMNPIGLAEALTPRLAYSEAINPGHAEMLIKEAKREAQRKAKR